MILQLGKIILEYKCIEKNQKNNCAPLTVPTVTAGSFPFSATSDSDIALILVDGSAVIKKDAVVVSKDLKLLKKLKQF